MHSIYRFSASTADENLRHGDILTANRLPRLSEDSVRHIAEIKLTFLAEYLVGRIIGNSGLRLSYCRLSMISREVIHGM